MAKSVLIVDDEEDLRDLFSQVIEAAGYSAQTASGGHEALKMVNDNSFDAILTDIRMPKGDGAELLKKLKEKFPQLPVYIMSGYNDYSVYELLKLGAEKVYTKPFNYEDFLKELTAKFNL
jgi:two-component system response regulator (stage 0 sporulation protein F)